MARGIGREDAGKEHADAPKPEEASSGPHARAVFGGRHPDGQGERPEAEPEEPDRQQPAVGTMHIMADRLVQRIEAGLKPVEGQNRNDKATDAGQSEAAEHGPAALSPQFLQFHVASPAWWSGTSSFGPTRISVTVRVLHTR